MADDKEKDAFPDGEKKGNKKNTKSTPSKPARYFNPSKNRSALKRLKGHRHKEKLKPDPEKVKIFSRGPANRTNNVFKKKFKHQLVQSEKHYTLATEQAARTELLLSETPGYLEAEGIERTFKFTQKAIAAEVDIQSAEKSFDLRLDQFGPYHINYTRNGRFLLIGGRKGHVASIDWQTKRLCCEFQVQETVRDVKWLHNENFFAVAQKKYVYIYDNGGTEIHRLKEHQEVNNMEFLPYHFLLATVGGFGVLRYVDTSTGTLVSEIKTKLGKSTSMAQNPYNAVVHLGHNNGTVTLWSPTVKDPLVKMLTQRGPVRSIAIDHRGLYMVTSGVDGLIKIWDVRTYKSLHAYKLFRAANSMAISQSGLLGVGFGPHCYVFKDAFSERPKMPYMTHLIPSSELISVQFCPYEDVLGVGHSNGFASLLIPGSGEPNFDALESNPYQSKRQRRENEVKLLLDKIQPEFITLDPREILKVEKKPKKTQGDHKEQDNVAFQPKHKAKGKSKSSKVEQRKKGYVEEKKRAKLQQDMLRKKKEERRKRNDKNGDIKHALDIFNSG